MTIVLEKEIGRQYVRLEFEGSVPIGKLEQSRVALKNILRESGGYSKALVDARRSSVALSIPDIYHFVSSHGAELPPGLRLAVIVKQEDWAAASFAEDVARNRGIHMKVFREDLHARAWLGMSDAG